MNKYAKFNYYEITTRNGTPDSSIFTINSNFLSAGYIVVLITNKTIIVHIGGITSKTGTDWPLAVASPYRPFIDEYFWYNNSGAEKRGFVEKNSGCVKFENLNSGNQISGTVMWNMA